VEAIVEDDVLSRFDSEMHDDWNFLTRTKRHYRNIPTKLKVVWVIGVIVRYTVLFPIRVVLFMVWVGHYRRLMSKLELIIVPVFMVPVDFRKRQFSAV
jgi:hypothetical protein